MKVFSLGKVTVFVMALVLAIMIGPRAGVYFSPSVPAYAQVGTCSLVGDAPATLTWADNATNEAGFEIERSTNGGAFVVIDTVKADTKSYVDSTVTSGATPNMYAYRVRAFNAGGKSAYSNVGCKTIKVLPPNGVPSNLVVE